MSRNTEHKNLIVFDMDGVIIDVSGSYRDAVRQTARLFFQGAALWERLPDPLFSLADLARVKQGGGLNNDWDLTFLVINLLLTRVNGLIDLRNSDPWTRYRKAIKGCDVSDLCRFLRSEKRPISTLMKEKGMPENEFIAGLYTGDVGSGNVIKQIFQEIYLGKDLFKSTYGIPAKVACDEGLISREKLLIDRQTLEHLSRNNVLAIATGRPGAEADYPLDFFNIRAMFTTVFSLDDCLGEEQNLFEQEKITVSLSKPNPYMLDAIQAAQNQNFSKFYYVGDMPDDMLAASRARAEYIGIGILISSSDKDRLKRDLLQAGADYIIEDFAELVKIVESEK